MNTATLSGWLGGDPETKPVNDTTVTRFSLATKDYGAKAETTWFNIVAWGKTGELIQQYCKKGSRVLVNGKIKINNYTDNAGNKKTSIEIHVHSFPGAIEFLDKVEKSEKPVEKSADYSDLPF